MKSPITGIKMSLIESDSSIIYKGKKVYYKHLHYVCPTSGHTYTTTITDTINYSRIKEAYALRSRPYIYLAVGAGAALGFLIVYLSV